MMTWWRHTKLSSLTAWAILVVFSLSLSCLAHPHEAPPPEKHGVKAEVELEQESNETYAGENSNEDSCDPVDHGEGRGGMRCLGCRYSADPAPKNCDSKKVYECYKGEVCVIRLQKSDSGKGHIEKGCTSMYKNKQFNKWIDIHNTAMGDIQTQEMLCNDTDCCNTSDEPYDLAVSFKASLLITVLMIVLTKLANINI